MEEKNVIAFMSIGLWKMQQVFEMEQKNTFEVPSIQ